VQQTGERCAAISTATFHEAKNFRKTAQPAKDLRDKFTPLQFDALHHVSCLSHSVSLDNYPLFVGRDAARHQQDTLPRGKQKGRNLVLQVLTASPDALALCGSTCICYLML
ncbi:hypothetical protein PROFUN_17145, partial [Planoprotostelium fungivorum]